MRKLLLSCLVVLPLLGGCATGTLSVTSYGSDSKEYWTSPGIASQTLLQLLQLADAVPVSYTFGDPRLEPGKRTYVWITAGVSGVYVER